MSAFDDMRDVLFTDPNHSETMTFAGVEGVRIMRREFDEVLETGQTRRLDRARLFDVRQSEVAQPAKGQTVVAADATFTLIAAPRLEEGVWTCEVKPV